MYGRTSNNIFSRNNTSSSSSGSNNIFAKNTTSTYGNNNSYSNNSSPYGATPKLGTNRVSNYQPTNPPRCMEEINPKWKSTELNPISIATRPEVMHLSLIQLRVQDYYLIRTQKLKRQETVLIQEAVDKNSFSTQLMNSHIVANLKQPLTFKEGQVNLDILRQFNKNRPLWGTTNTNTNSYGNNSYGNNSSYGSNNTNRSIFGGSNNSSGNNIFNRNTNTSTNNVFSNNNQNSSGNNIFQSNNRTGNNIFATNNNNNSSGGNIFAGNNNSSNNNPFNRNNNTTSNNPFNSNNNNNNNNNSIFNRSGNNNGGNNIFNSNNNQNQGNNIFNSTNRGGNIFNNNNGGGNNNNIFSNNNQGNNIFNNSNNSNGNNIFSNSNNNQQGNNLGLAQYTMLKLFESQFQMINTCVEQSKIISGIKKPQTYNTYEWESNYDSKSSPYLPSVSTYLSSHPTLAMYQPLQQAKINIGQVGNYKPDFSYLPRYDNYEQDQEDYSLWQRKTHKPPSSLMGIQNYIQPKRSIYQENFKPYVEMKKQKQQMEQAFFHQTKSVYMSQSDIGNPQNSLNNHSRMINNAKSTISDNKSTNILFVCTFKLVEQERKFNSKKRFEKPMPFQQTKTISIHNNIAAIEEWYESECSDLNQLYHIKRVDIVNIDHSGITADVFLTKINLPESYFFKPRQFQDFEVENLQITNEYGSIRWLGRVNIKGVDFKNGFSIEKGRINCNIPQLDRECIAIFNNVPDELVEMDEQTARETLDRFFKTSVNGDITLQNLTLNPPEFRIRIKKFPELAETIS